MAKFAFLFTYSSDAWARMIQSPGDRTAAIRQLTTALDGSVEFVYWMSGPYDGILVADLPDSVSAAALSVAVGSTGSFKHVETHELFGQDQLAQTLARAAAASGKYQAPGQQQ